jgi:hypothetical protein
MKHISKIALLILVAASVYACFPTSIGFKDASMDPDLKFFSVENFEQIAPNTPMNYPVQFTEFLKDGIVSNTKLKLLPVDNANTHLVFSGDINRFDLMPVSIQTDNQAAQTRLTVGMKVSIENLLKPDKSMNFNVVRFVDFNSDSDYNALENQLLENINQQLLQDILNQLQSDW